MTPEPTGAEDFDLYAHRPQAELEALYREFRTGCPVARSEQNGGFWVVSTYEDVHTIARDAESFSNAKGIIIPPVDIEPLIPNDIDPPEHGKYRGILQAWLAPGSVKRFEPRLREMARGHLAGLDSPCDMVKEFTLPLALQGVTTVLGIPADMSQAMLTMMSTLLGEGDFDYTNAAAAMNQFGEFAQQVLIDPRRAIGPTDDPNDVVDLLVGAEIDGRKLNYHEIRQTILALLGAGFETTYKGLAFCLWTLAEDKEAWKALKTGAVDFGTAFEELLRLSSPVSVGRTATRDVCVGGQTIRAGDSVLMLLPAANRDEAAFPDAACLDLTRQPNRHITFGAGVHRCIGMHLARLELTVALEEVLAAFDRISIPEGCGPTFTGSQAAGIVNLPLEFVRSPGTDV
jgi:cytochrome P450